MYTHALTKNRYTEPLQSRDLCNVCTSNLILKFFIILKIILAQDILGNQSSCIVFIYCVSKFLNIKEGEIHIYINYWVLEC